jgi:dihydrofolate synthase/folylpolyglutamate synthase
MRLRRRTRSASIGIPFGDPTLTYPTLIAELFPRLTGGIHWGLDRTRRLLATVGDPHLQYPCIHVGGTNGKGSVAASIAAILRERGLRTGLYTSPHLCSFRERIRIDGEPIAEAALLSAAERLWPAIGEEHATFFEATTAIGLLALADAGVDIAVIEVGLGGRLDSTNVIAPLVSVITNISLDHVQLLGNTLDAVAREKAGIVKAGVPLVTGESVGPAADVLMQTAAERGAERIVVAETAVTVTSMGMRGTTFSMSAAGARPHAARDFTTPLLGAHQAWNAALAVVAVEQLPAALRPTADQVRNGLSNVRWPGRLQVEQIAGGTWIFDVAHNPAGVDALVAALRQLDVVRPVTVVAGVLGDKDWGAMLAPLAAWADRLILTMPPTAPADRRWDLDTAFDSLQAERDQGRAIERTADFEAALRQAAGSGTVLVTGSFHTVGDALAMLRRCDAAPDVTLPEVVFRR